MDTPDRLSHFTDSKLSHARSLDFARFLSALYQADGAGLIAAKYFAARWPRSVSCDLITKAAVDAGTTADASWAHPLFQLRPLSDVFVDLLRPATLIGKIANLKHVPFNVPMVSQSTAVGAAWVGQGSPKPITAPAFDAAITLGPAKASGMVVVSKELILLTGPGAELALRDAVLAGVSTFLDQQFVDSAVTATAAHPASITNGVVAIAPSGTTAAALVTDLKALIAAFVAANPGAAFPVVLMTPAMAATAAIATNAATLTVAGGTIFGIPVVTSPSVGPRIIAIDAAAILVADDGAIHVDVSQQATLQMNDAPTDPPVAATVQVSLWQHGLVAIRADRMINWQRARASAVQQIAPVAYV